MSGARDVPNQLVSLGRSVSGVTLRQLFSQDPQRATAFSQVVSLGDTELLVDYSKQQITADAMSALVAFAGTCGLVEQRDAMVAGGVVNATEGRAATHMATRAVSDATATAALRAESQANDRKLADAAAAVPSSITHVVNIGIGGSDLGPALVCDALAAMRPMQREVRFASNIDPLDLDRALTGLQGKHTLFVVCSKSFGTSETLSNARRATEWLTAQGVQRVADHFIVVTAQPERVAATGITAGWVLTMPESVGGRYSVSSSVAVAVALVFGLDALHEVRDGMRLIDEHFVQAPLDKNLPVVHGLIGWWNATVLGYASAAVIPYSRALHLLPAYLQQLMMESNGKSVDVNGAAVARTSPVVWGGVGTNAQHAFFQLLHQGTQVVPCDFIGCSAALGSSQADHDVLVANMLAQSQALAFGVARDEVDGSATLQAHRATPGNRPSTTLLFSRLTPRAVGALIAFYEHVTFVQGVLWGINSFDQWGVELGKQLATQIEQDMKGTPTKAHDASTDALLAQHRQWRITR